MSTRVIKIWSSTNGVSTINSAATTWGQLKQELSSTMNVSNLQAVENVRKTSLESPSAELPEGPFTLFLRPKDTKSGYLTDSDKKEIMEMIESKVSSPNHCNKEEIDDFCERIDAALNNFYEDDVIDLLHDLLHYFKGINSNTKSTKSREDLEAESIFNF